MLHPQFRKQKAVLWRRLGYDRYGQSIIGQPIQLNVRWQKKREEATDNQGNPIATDATIYVDREIEIGSIVWLGTIDTLPESITGLLVVIECEATPDIKGREIVYRLLCMRYKDGLPEYVGTGTF